MMKASERLRELGVTLPPVAAPVGSYVPALISGSKVFTSGQLPMREGKLMGTGKVPSDVSEQEAAEGARVAVLNALAAIADVAGGIDNIVRIVRLCVYVNSSPGFTAQSKVANGASDFLVEVFGGAGKHARLAVGVAELPLNASVELELIAEVA
ncbi:MAG: RidA family protein [Phycisphaerales bacterium]|nr:MAG: RidA family protein [Phycisphaerales bacterium]